jgi:hypothetical protein
MVPLPGHDYLTRIGQIVYMVGYLEWVVLGDLADLGDPGGLTLNDLAGLPTGEIAKRLTNAAPSIADPVVSRFIATAGSALTDVRDRRNGVMHARPITGPGDQQVLHRSVPGPKPAAEQFTVDVPRLDELIADIDSWVERVFELRTAARAAAGVPL